MNWISIEERLPEAHQDVLLWTAGQQEVRLGWRADSDAWATWNEAFADVSHWMPLPTAPSAH